MSARIAEDGTLKTCQYLWDEYKYRHDLVWQRVLRIAAAIVLISIIPYIREDIARLSGPWISTAPLLATLAVGVNLFQDTQLVLGAETSTLGSRYRFGIRDLVLVQFVLRQCFSPMLSILY